MPLPLRSLHPLGLACVLAGVAVPATAAAAPAQSTNDALIDAAKASPLFRSAIKRGGLRKAGLATVSLRPGVEMDVLRYVQQTALDKHANYAPLFDEALRVGWLAGAPSYSESILVLDDRLVIDRRLTVPLQAGACTKGGAPAAVASICFAPDAGKAKAAADKGDAAKALAQELSEIRGKLAKADPGKIVRGTITAKQALDMDDDTLVGFLLEGDARTIHHVSIVPRVSVVDGAKQADKLDSLDAPLPVVAGAAAPAEPKAAKPDVAALPGADKSFAREYFLTGFTYGRELEDTWEYTLADSTWLTDRYYVRFSYHLSFGFGVRAPFSVDVKARGDNGSRTIDVSVAPVDVDAQGSPAYAAVGLPANQTFDGKEFVLQFTAGCSFYASIPGPNVGKSCPNVGKNFSRDIDPVIGTESSAIADWWLPGSDTGLGVDLSIASASVDIGLGADVTNGRIRLDAGGISGAQTTGVPQSGLAFANRDAVSFGMSPSGATDPGRLRLSAPRYGFDLRLRPKLRGHIGVDVGVWDHDWIIGPYALDFLSISQGFVLGRHPGTVAQHDYAVFDTGLVLDPDVPVKPPVKPPKNLPVDPGAGVVK
ncbi:MAG: hypothetical protein U0168_23210 [Nannocystaceae bacterium]